MLSVDKTSSLPLTRRRLSLCAPQPAKHNSLHSVVCRQVSPCFPSIFPSIAVTSSADAIIAHRLADFLLGLCPSFELGVCLSTAGDLQGHSLETRQNILDRAWRSTTMPPGTQADPARSLTQCFPELSPTRRRARLSRSPKFSSSRRHRASQSYLSRSRPRPPPHGFSHSSDE